MKLPKIFITGLAIFFCISSATGQNYYEPKLSFSVDLGIPTKGKNYSFSKVMEGLFNGGITMQYNIIGGLTAGLGVKYSYFSINSYVLNNAQWGGGMHFPAGYFKLGYEKFTTERISFNISARAGYSVLFAIHGNDSCAIDHDKTIYEPAFFIEPQVEILMLTDKVSSDGFSLVLGYPIYFNEFGPRYLCMEKFTSFNPEDSQGITRFFSFGFGYRYYFGRK